MAADYKGHPSQRWGHVSYAQHGDDFVIINVFEKLNIAHPSYLDIGAHHPFDISNTALLYERGSRGVNVEANPNLMAAFLKHRPKDVNVCCGVGIENGDMPFYLFGEDHGLNTFSEKERDKTIASGAQVLRVQRLPVKTINTIVEEYCAGKWPDLLTVDIEGLDYAVIQSADFSKSYPELICVETRQEDFGIMTDLLRSKGYSIFTSMGENLLFIRIQSWSR